VSARRARSTHPPTDPDRGRDTPAETPRSPKGERTRARLVEAAKSVFERDGFLEARITDIADAAGVSHGSFYHYFTSKEEIFREVAEQQEVSLIRLVSGDGPAARPLDRIRSANREYLTAYIDAAKIMRVIEEVSRYDDEIRAARQARDDEFAERLQRSIHRLQREGLADKRIEPRYAAHALGCMVNRFAEMCARDGSRDLDKSIEQLTLLWANAIGLSADAR
jgi:AcrR family transcriptional regulator